MSLIGMVVFSTEENGKDKYLERTLESLQRTVNFKDNRLILSINGFTDETNKIVSNYSTIISEVIVNNSNLGTAEALNHVIKRRKAKENVVKIDDDIVISQSYWVDIMQEAIGIIQTLSLKAI
jgi:glycosyltransferase involved in cell wall biosynthesis